MIVTGELCYLLSVIGYQACVNWNTLL